MSEQWSDAPSPESMADALNNLTWALDQMLDAVEEGRYRYDPIHVNADLYYLRGEARRARRRNPAEADQ